MVSLSAGQGYTCTLLELYPDPYPCGYDPWAHGYGSNHGYHGYCVGHGSNHGFLTFFGVYLIFDIWNTCRMTMLSRKKLSERFRRASRESIHDFRCILSHDIPRKHRKMPQKMVFQWSFNQKKLAHDPYRSSTGPTGCQTMTRTRGKADTDL